MEVIKAQICNQGEECLHAVPAALAAQGKLLQESFGAALDTVQKAYAAELQSNPGKENASLTALWSQVRDAMAADLDMLTTLQRWIYVLVPKIEDGGNFGVGIQLDVLKMLKAQIEALEKSLDALPDYFGKRADAMEKVVNKTSKTTKKTSSKTQSKGGKDGDEDKASSSETVEDSATESTALPDALQNVVAIDMRCYLQLRKGLEQGRDAVLIAADMTSKNMDKILKPKGNSEGGGSSFMF
ncbi:unnamed protein product [Chrysoparadoxa australica]